MPRVGFCAVKDLPSSIQDALASVGYGRKDVAVESAEQVSICDPGGAGRKAFAILLDLATGESKTHWGSWEDRTCSILRTPLTWTTVSTP